MVNQVQWDYLAKDLRMVDYLDEVKAISTKIKDFKIRQIPREENKKANALTNLASTFDFISDKSVPLEFLQNLSIEITKFVCQIEAGPTWMDDIIAYLWDVTLRQTSSKLVEFSTELPNFTLSMEFNTRDLF